MDAQDAFDILDALAKEPVTELAPLQVAALRCAAESPEIEREYRLRTPFDRQISELMRDVEIPTGLRQRLLENAQRESDQSNPAIDQSILAATKSRGFSRRSVFAVLSGGALAACVLFFFLFQTTPLVSTEIDRALTELWGVEAQPFDGNFTPELPLAGWRTSSIRFAPHWSGSAFDERSRHDLAFKRFEFLSNRGILHEGLLAVVPSSRLETKPNNHDPFTGEIRYLTATDGSQYAVVSWTEPEFDLIFFLAVPADDHSLKALQDVLSRDFA